MATKKEVDVDKIVVDRLVKVDKALDSMAVGSDQFAKGIEALTKLSDAHATLEEKRIDEADKVEKREEQKRINDNDIEHKAFEDAMNMKRYEMEKEFKTNQNRITFGQVVAQSVINGVALGLQTSLTHRAFRQEYLISNGDSLLPPKNVANELKGFNWFVRK